MHTIANLLLVHCLLCRFDSSELSATLKGDPPESLPEAIDTAWKDAGAQVGWLRPSNASYFEFIDAGESKPGDLAAFRVFRWQDGMLAKLPDPARPFGRTYTVSRYQTQGSRNWLG
jgi:hypothetical protein